MTKTTKKNSAKLFSASLTRDIFLKLKKVEEVAAEYRKAHGRDPGEDILARLTGMRVSTVRKSLMLNELLYVGLPIEYRFEKDYWSDPASQKNVVDLLYHLDPLTRLIFESYYGVGQGRRASKEELSILFNMDEGDVCHHLTEGCTRIRHLLQN